MHGIVNGTFPLKILFNLAYKAPIMTYISKSVLKHARTNPDYVLIKNQPDPLRNGTVLLSFLSKLSLDSKCL